MDKSLNNQQLLRKILFTIGVLIVYRFGTFVPIPGINPDVLKAFFNSEGANIFGMVNLFSGGALERMSVFALNIMPYITASIIMQLLSSMIPVLESLKKDGESGRARVNQYTRYLTIILAFFQSVGVYYALSSGENSMFVTDSITNLFTTVLCLVGGTVILMWFGERITTNGIGNGISLIIFFGIISSLPSTVSQIFTLSKTGVFSWIFVVLLIVLFIFLISFVCFFEKCYRKVKIQYPNSSMLKKAGMSDFTYLPLKINLSGVIPPIFASSILMFPSAIMQFAGVSSEHSLFLFRRGEILYSLLFSILIVFFSFFYSSVVFNSKDVSENLKKNNCFLLGVRPGSATELFLSSLVNKLTILGALYLVIICVLPEILISKYSLPLYFGGTGVLIIVNVIFDIVNQFQSHMISNNYSSNTRRKRLRVRI